MPEYFDDIGQRNQEALYQIRQPASLTSNPLTDMAYTAHRPPYQTQQLGTLGRSPGLPPIRDIDPGIKFDGFNNGYITTNGYPSTMYSNSIPTTPQYANDSFGNRRQPSLYGDKGISHTYPPSNRPYPPIKPEYPTSYQAPHDPYQNRSAYGDYPYTPTGMSGASYNSPVSSHLADGGDGRNRRRRGNLPKAITDVLRAWFQEHLDHPYPSEEEKQMFIQQTGLSMNQACRIHSRLGFKILTECVD